MRLDQLPELAGDGLEFTWDFAEMDGETYQIIQPGNAEIWRELAFFENIDRFNEVKELLRKNTGKDSSRLRQAETVWNGCVATMPGNCFG
jgi:hypothetical protein